MRRLALLLLLAGCASAPDERKPAAERYADAWTAFDMEAEGMLRAAGKNRLKVEACAGRARAALDSMGGLLEGAPAARLAAIGERLGALSTTIASGDAASSGDERAVTGLRDEVARDFAPGRVTLVAREPEPPQPAPAGAMERWEAAHRRFEEDARGSDSARLVQDYSELRDAMRALVATDDDRFRVDRFLREYERLAAAAPASEQDLKALSVLAADIRAAFGGER